MLRTFVFCLVFVAVWTALDSLDKWSHAEMLKQEQQQVVPCDTDTECEALNPHIKEEE